MPADAHDTPPAPLPFPAAAQAAGEPSWHLAPMPDARLSVRYELRTGDHWRGNARSLRRQWPQLLAIVVAGGVLLTAPSLLNPSRRQPPLASEVFLEFAATTAHLAFWYSVLAAGLILWNLHRARRAAGQGRRPVTTTTLADSGVLDESAHQTIRLAWAEVTAVEAWGGGNVTLVRRRAGRNGPSVYIPRSAFADEAAARRFREAAELLRAGRGAEIPEATLHEFAPQQN